MSDKPKGQIGFRPTNKSVEPYMVRLSGEMQVKYGHKVTKTDIINTWLEHGMVTGEMEQVCDEHFKSIFQGEVVNA